MYTVKYSDDALTTLQDVAAGIAKTILDTIDEQLSSKPTESTRNKKALVGLKAPWPHLEPLRELRIRQYRAFYDVDEEAMLVTVRVIRHKPPHRTTEEIL